MPRVALAGYTNAGKSTLLNALTGAEVGVGDRLFHTLDPTTRSLELSGRDYLLTDTVGFIEKLPHQLVEAFKATLEETVLADLILHVVDAAAPEERRLADMRAVDEVLEEIGAGESPRLLVLNKADLLDPEGRDEALLRHPDAILVSALTGEGLDELRDRIETAFADTLAEVELLIPYAEGARLSELHEVAGDLDREDRPDGVFVRAASRSGAASLRGLSRERGEGCPSPAHARVATMELPVAKLKARGRAALASARGRRRLGPLCVRGCTSRAGGAVERRDGSCRGDPGGACRAGASEVRAGEEARDRAGQRTRPDRFRLPRRAPGAPAQHGSRRDLPGRTRATASRSL